MSPNKLHITPARSSEGAFRVRSEVWGERGACGRSRKPFPGGSGPPLGRHYDRPPRSSVDWRQAKTGNARRAGSQETRELELSQGWMRSAWRVPRWSAGRRARRVKARCRAEATASGDVCRCCAAPNEFAPSGAPLPRLVARLRIENEQNSDAEASREQRPCRNQIGSNLLSVEQFRAYRGIQISSLYHHTLPPYLLLRQAGLHQKAVDCGCGRIAAARAANRCCDL